MTIFLYTILGLVAGTLSGLFGIGGATIIVPALVFILGMSQHSAQGTTLALMVPPIGILAALKYYNSGNVNLKVATFICLGFVVGGLIGAIFAHQIPETLLRKLFGGFLLVVAIRMIAF